MPDDLFDIIRDYRSGTDHNSAVAPDEIESMVLKKLKQCRVLFDFTKALSDVSQKDIKRDALLELVEYFSTNRGFLTANIYKELIEMV